MVAVSIYFLIFTKIMTNFSSSFIALTYTDDRHTYTHSISTLLVQKFVKCINADEPM